MKRVTAVLSRVFVAFAMLLLALVVVIIAFTQTDRFREIVRQQAVHALSALVPARVSIGRVEGSIWSGIGLVDVVADYHDDALVQVRRLEVHYRLLSLLTGRLHVSRLEVIDPSVVVRRLADGTWNVANAFRVPAGQESSNGAVGLDVVVEKAVVRGGALDLVLTDDYPERYRVTNLTLSLHGRMSAGGLLVQVDSLSCNVVADPYPVVRVDTALTYREEGGEATLEISALQLDGPHSVLLAHGQIRDFESPALDASLTLEKLSSIDLRSFRPDWPLRPDISGEVRLTGSLADLRATLELRAAGAEVSGHVRVDLEAPTPVYSGDIRLAGADLQALLGTGLAGVVDGSAEVRGVGTELSSLETDARLEVRSLQAGAWRLGHVVVAGSLKNFRGSLQGTVTGGLGRASWQGEIQLTPQPTYTVAVSVQQLDIEQVSRVAGHDALSGRIALTANVAGTGLDLSTMNTRATLRVLPSQIGGVTVDQARLTARIEAGRIIVSEFDLVANGTRIEVNGELGTTVADGGSLSYSVRVARLAPWLALAGRDGNGRLSLQGTAKGGGTDVRLAGKLALDNLQLGTLSVERGSVSFDLQDLASEWPRGSLTAVLDHVEAGTSLRTLELAVTSPPGQDQRAKLTLHGRDARTYGFRVEAVAVRRPDQVVVSLEELSLRLPDGLWQIARPATILWRSDGLTLDELRLVSRDQTVALTGRYSPNGSQDLRLDIQRLALAGLQRFLPQEPSLAGLVSGRIAVQGTAAVPLISGRATATDLRVADQHYSELAVSLDYRADRVSLDVVFQQATDHVLTLTGGFPLRLSWAHGWTSELYGEVDLRAHSSGLNLAFLGPLVGPAVQDVGGQLEVDMRLSGPILRPVPRGTMRLKYGRAKVVDLGIVVSELSLELEADREAIRISRLSAKARDGTLAGRGTVTLHDYLPQRLELTLDLDRWPAIHTSRYKAQLGGRLTASGPIAGPMLAGRLEVSQVTVRPDLSVLAERGIQPDATITVIPVGSTTEEVAVERLKKVAEPKSQSVVLRGLSVDVTVVVARNAWIRHPQAAVELAGQVQAKKERGGTPRLAGIIQIVGGWVGFQGRRFTLEKGRVTFGGGKQIDPTLDIVAQYKLPDYTVDVLVGGTAEQPTLTLRSEPTLEQADILAVLLFGKPVSALSQGQQVDLQQQALAITGGYAAAKIGESVSRALGLEELGTALEVSGGGIGIGQYLTEDIHVSASQDLTQQGERQVEMEYQLTPNWEVFTSTSSSGRSAAGIVWKKRY